MVDLPKVKLLTTLLSLFVATILANNKDDVMPEPVEKMHVNITYMHSDAVLYLTYSHQGVFNETTLVERVCATRLNTITNHGTTKRIPKISKARCFVGHLTGCHACTVDLVYFRDINKGYGVFELHSQTLYLLSDDGLQFYFISVPKTPKAEPTWKETKAITNTLITTSVTVDDKAYQQFGNDQLAAYRYLVVTFELTNRIFKKLVFGENKNNELITGIHFGIKEFCIVSGSDYDYGHHTKVDMKKLLWSFAENANCGDYGVAVIITGRDSYDDIIGKAITGEKGNNFGIYGRKHEGKATNVVLLSISSNGALVSIFDRFRRLAHEFCHSAGCRHGNPDDKTIMAPQETDGSQESHHTFSVDAINGMKEVISHVQPHFELSGETSECGSGILEAGKEMNAPYEYVLITCVLLAILIVASIAPNFCLAWKIFYGNKSTRPGDETSDL